MSTYIRFRPIEGRVGERIVRSDCIWAVKNPGDGDFREVELNTGISQPTLLVAETVDEIVDLLHAAGADSVGPFAGADPNE